MKDASKIDPFESDSVQLQQGCCGCCHGDLSSKFFDKSKFGGRKGMPSGYVLKERGNCMTNCPKRCCCAHQAPFEIDVVSEADARRMGGGGVDNMGGGPQIPFIYKFQKKLHCGGFCCCCRGELDIFDKDYRKIGYAVEECDPMPPCLNPWGGRTACKGITHVYDANGSEAFELE